MSGMTLFILLVCIIALLFLGINLVFAPHNPYQEKDSAFECGFHSFLQSRSPFNIAFFIYALLYLLLDLEILLIFPYSVSAYTNEVYGLIGVLVFILIITAGFIFELGKGALNISSRQSSDLTAKRKNISITYLGKIKLNNESGSGKKYYSTVSIPTSSDTLAHEEKNCKGDLNSWFITGFADAEGCFYCGISKDLNNKLGWRCSVGVFQIKLHIRDLPILENIKLYFKNAGNITTTSTSANYRITSLKEIVEIVIPHFDKYPLITQKKADYILYKKGIDLISSKKHLTPKGLQEFVNIKASINLGLSEELQKAFPNTVPVIRPEIENQRIPNDSWLAGFVSGEGCFKINTFKSTSKLGHSIALRLQVSQHIRDIKLIESFISYLGCGILTKRNDSVLFEVSKFNDIWEKIIPFFQKTPIMGVKELEFKEWYLAAEIIKTKKHLTQEGLDEIYLIKSRMNTGREYN